MIGVSPWDSPRAMWHMMRGEAPWPEESPAMERGTLCEPAVLAWWRKHREHEDWREQVSMTVGDWCAATPDAAALTEAGQVLVEAKTANANSMEHWGQPETDEIPVYYLTQVHLAMEVAHLNGIPVIGTHVPVLGGRRLEFANYFVAYDAEFGAQILDRCREFYDSLDGDAPPLDDSVATYEAVRRVHPDIEDAEVELTDDLAGDLVTFAHLFKETETSLRGAKAAVIDAMGSAKYATHNGRRIARRQPGKFGVTFVVTGKPDQLKETA